MEADIAYIFPKKVVKIDLWLVVAFYCLFLRMKLSNNNFVLVLIVIFHCFDLVVVLVLVLKVTAVEKYPAAGQMAH